MIDPQVGKSMLQFQTQASESSHLTGPSSGQRLGASRWQLPATTAAYLCQLAPGPTHIFDFLAET
jgi:hypothetical protein